MKLLEVGHKVKKKRATQLPLGLLKSCHKIGKAFLGAPCARKTRLLKWIGLKVEVELEIEGGASNFQLA